MKRTLLNFNNIFTEEDGTFRKCPVDIFSERASWREGMAGRFLIK